MSARETNESGSGHSRAADRTVLKVVRGAATAEELAAVVALLVSATRQDSIPLEPRAGSLWATPQLRTPLSHGPHSWRASGLPR